MIDENILKAVKEAAGPDYILLQNKVHVLAPTYEGEVEKRLATFIGPEGANEGDFYHVELTVEDTKAEIVEKIKQALKKA